MHLVLVPKVGGQYTYDYLTSKFPNTIFIKDNRHNRNYALINSMLNTTQISQSTMCIRKTKRLKFNNPNDILYATTTGSMKKTEDSPIIFTILSKEVAKTKHFTPADVLVY